MERMAVEQEISSEPQGAEVSPDEAEVSPDAAKVSAQETGQTEVSAQEKVVQNSSLYLLGQLLTWSVALVTVAIIPRRLGEVAWGQLMLANTILSPLMVLFGFSIDQYLMTECGRDPAQSERLVRATLGLRLVCIPFFVVSSVLALYLCQATGLVPISRTVWILSIFPIIGTAIGYLFGLMRFVLAGWEDAVRVTRIDFLVSLIPFATIPFLGFGALGFTFANLVFAQPTSLYAALAVRRRIRLRPVFDIELSKRILRGSMGFLVNDVVAPFSAVGTVAVLRHYTNDATIGVYQQSVRLVGTFMFVPSAIGMALLPSLARMADAGGEGLKRMQQRVLVAVMVLGLPIVVMAWMIADPFCRLLYGKEQFQTLPMAVRVSGLCIIPLYVTIIMYRFLVAERKQSVWSLFMLGTMALNALLCWILVPLFLHSRWHSGLIGAVLATAGAEAFTMTAALVLLKINPFDRDTLGRMLRALCAASAMAGVMWLTRNLFFPITAACGLLTFGWLAWRLQTLGRDDQEKLAALVTRKLKPLLKRIVRKR